MLLRSASSRNNMMVDGAPVNDIQRSHSQHEEDFSTIHSASEDDAASSKSPGGTSTGSSTGQQSDDPDGMYFGHTMSRHVRGLKLMVFGILFLVTVAVCCAVYLVTDRGQYDEFQAAFEGDAIKVVKSFEDILVQKIGALAAFSVTVTSYALQSGSPWPFVTMNNFAERAASAKSLSKVLTVQVIPKVDGENLGLWNNYSFANKEWVDEMRQHQKDQKIPYELNQYDGPPTQIVPFIYSREGAASGEGPFYPFWQQTPLFPAPLDLVNFDILASLGPGPRSNFDIAANTNQVAIGGMLMAPPGDVNSNNTQTRYYSQWISFDEKTQTNYTGEPLSTVFLPIMESFEADSKPAAVLITVLQWGRYFEDILSPSALPLDIVLSNTCDEDIHTFSIRGVNVEYRGNGNRASTRFEDIAETAFVDENGFVIEEDTIQLTLNQDVCRYTLKVYPTEEHYNHYNDNFPIIITATVAAVFLFTVAVIIAYDIMIEKRQRQVLDTAKRSTAIVSSIFPKNVRDKLMSAPVQGNATKLRTLAQQGNTSMDISDIGKGGPIADLFPDCTVMFADIEGFTAWSSVREPSQVFTLLETLYAAMDATATRRRVFKVETVGDCYVAVCGLPEPKDDHAVTIARFARDCIEQHISIVTGKLERDLGPETGELRLRVGIHSGPITAGVLRGKGSRFQLFGDTVNTCARLESSSDGNKIHTSEATANLLIAGGYADWITARPGVVNLKGKGAMKTFWVEPVGKKDKFSSVRKRADSISLDESLVEQAGDPSSAKKARLVTWNVDILMRSLAQIIARRDSFANLQAPAWQTRGLSPLEEVVEVIQLPSKAASPSLRRDPNSIKIDPAIRHLVHDYVSCLADLYHDNQFHNFEHASHVTMSVAKLLSRIVAPSDMDFRDSDQAEAQLHDHTYGITSDPLTQFACTLSALIHDVDHQGVSNTTLVAEQDALTRVYGGKSVAEQNSVDQAWDLLMTEHFRPLLALLCRDKAELARFRQLVVNSVLATDIMDADLKKLRNARWDKAFKLGNDEEGGEAAINRKATIVIEHLIQASDVAHTMQHWNIYTKWNGRLFKEMYKAFIDGREGAKDPSAFWAKGEIGFFDFYIIPLTKKLKECGVFGASSDEYLNYAISNRKEWEMKGEMIVESLIEEVRKEYGEPRK